MTKEKISEMARVAGFGDFAHQVGNVFDKFAEMVATAEREECLQLLPVYGAPIGLEAAIRARGQA